MEREGMSEATFIVLFNLRNIVHIKDRGRLRA